MPAPIDREFAEQFLRSVDDPGAHGVHLLFNQFWQYAPAEVAQSYADHFLAMDDARALYEEQYYADPMTVARLAQSPAGSLGEAMHEFIVANGLEQNLATNYRTFHQSLQDAGVLDGLPEPLRWAVLRGFQLHDFLHVVTGYGPSPGGEISLQAFCLAQTNFPYFAMWVAVTASRMTFVDPTTIQGLMDNVSSGWQYGRRVQNIQFHRWEDRIDEPLADLRAEFGLPAGGWDDMKPILMPELASA